MVQKHIGMALGFLFAPFCSICQSPAIEKEREKLRAKGFVVSYWIKDIAPSRSTEYWKNDETGECKHIVWNTADQSDVSSSSCDSKYRNNPYPKN